MNDKHVTFVLPWRCSNEDSGVIETFYRAQCSCEWHTKLLMNRGLATVAANRHKRSQ